MLRPSTMIPILCRKAAVARMAPTIFLQHFGTSSIWRVAAAKISFPVIPRDRTRKVSNDEETPPAVMTLEQEQTEEKEKQSPSQNYKTGFFRHFIAKLVTRHYFDNDLRMLLIKSASQLYFDCSNNYNFVALQKEFGLDDSYFAWYRLTLLHLWMALTRLQQSMEVYSYCFYRQQMTLAFHNDKTARYNIAFAGDSYARLKRRSKFQELYYDVYMSSLFDYDEGFLGNDQLLAGAVWRALFMANPEMDIVHLNRAIRYIRATMHFLDGIDTNQLLADGIDSWRPAEQIMEEQKQRYVLKP